MEGEREGRKGGGREVKEGGREKEKEGGEEVGMWRKDGG